MPFQLIPYLDQVEELYLQPRSPQRFFEYLSQLQGQSKDEMILPIAGFNPMAKDHVLAKVRELKALDAEGIVTKVLAELNQQLTPPNQAKIGVLLNLADDVKGAWTHRYVTDYDSKFKLNGLVNRRFCTPYLWVSEDFTPELIRQRTLEYAYRTWYWLTHPQPETLADFVQQERFVRQVVPLADTKRSPSEIEAISRFFEAHQDSSEYAHIFNFFYGDAASESMGYPTFGMPTEGGFAWAGGER